MKKSGNDHVELNPEDSQILHFNQLWCLQIRKYIISPKSFISWSHSLFKYFIFFNTLWIINYSSEYLFPIIPKYTHKKSLMTVYKHREKLLKITLCRLLNIFNFFIFYTILWGVYVLPASLNESVCK